MNYKERIKLENFVKDLAKSSKPVARFYYKGSHSHPVRRTVLITEETPTMITGLEFREGSHVRNLKQALKTIRSYRKSKIAKWGDYSRLMKSQATSKKNPKSTTLKRFPAVSIFSEVS
jgi:hypothetical protein